MQFETCNEIEISPDGMSVFGLLVSIADVWHLLSAFDFTAGSHGKDVHVVVGRVVVRGAGVATAKIIYYYFKK